MEREEIQPHIKKKTLMLLNSVEYSELFAYRNTITALENSGSDDGLLIFLEAVKSDLGLHKRFIDKSTHLKEIRTKLATYVDYVIDGNRKGISKNRKIIVPKMSNIFGVADFVTFPFWGLKCGKKNLIDLCEDIKNLLSED